MIESLEQEQQSLKRKYYIYISCSLLAQYTKKLEMMLTNQK